MRLGSFKVWRSPIVCWCLFVAFLIIAASSYPVSQVDAVWKPSPETVVIARRNATITIAIACFLAGASFILACCATKRRDDHVAS